MTESLTVALTLEQCWHDVPGGTARTALDLAAGLAGRPSVEVLGIAARHNDSPPEPWVPPVSVVHHRQGRRALYTSWHRRRRPLVEKLLARTGQRVHVVHATGMAVPATKQPLVVTVHDLAFEHYPDHPTRWGLRFFREAVAAAIAHADAVIVPSEATKRDCLEHGFEPERLHVVPWGIAWPLSDAAQVEAARRELDLPARFVLWVGTIEPRKNLDRLIAAFRRVAEVDRDLHLVLVGPQGWGAVPTDKGSAHDRIHPIGFVDAALLPAVYRAALVTCYPSLLEGFGMPVLESMSQGTPVVTSSGTATEEVLGEGGIAVAPSDVSAIADALRTLVDERGDGSNSEREQASAAAIARAQHLSIDRMVDRTIEVYRSVLV